MVGLVISGSLALKGRIPIPKGAAIGMLAGGFMFGLFPAFLVARACMGESKEQQLQH